MKRFSYVLLASSLVILALVGHSSMAATGSSHPWESAITTGFDRPGELIARRWNYRFNVRPSRYRRGGISRGEECPTKVLSSVTPPVDEEFDESTTATTYLGTAAHPTFYISIPRLPKTSLKLTVQLEDESSASVNFESALYEVEYVIDGEPGIVGLKTPTSLPPLEVGTLYRWQVSVFCAPDSENPLAVDDSMVLTGGVMRRVNDIASTSSRLDSYVEAGIWQDALALVAEAYYRNPTDAAAAQDWADLMETAVLPQFETTPIVAIHEGTILWQTAP